MRTRETKNVKKRETNPHAANRVVLERVHFLEIRQIFYRGVMHLGHISTDKSLKKGDNKLIHPNIDANVERLRAHDIALYI